MSDLRFTTSSGLDYTSSFTTYGPHNGILVVRNHEDSPLFLPDLVMHDGQKTWTLMKEGVGLRASLSDAFHVLRAGEAIPVQVGKLEVDEGRITRVHEGLNGVEDELLPLRLRGLMGAGRSKDLGWLMARKGDPYSKDLKGLEGWIQPYMVWDGDGAANARYNQVLHSASQYVGNGSLRSGLVALDPDLAVTLATGFAHVCTGYFTTGKYAGLPRPEKGKEAYGEQGDRPLWSKTWPEQLWVLKCLTGHPYLEWLWVQFLYALADTDPKWWDGLWGARGPARYLDALLLAYHTEPEHRSGFESRAAKAIAHYKTLVDPTHGIWVNKTPQKTSPWMNCQLTTSCGRWAKIHDTDTTWLHRIAETLATNYTTPDYGVFYRCAGPEAKPLYRTSSAWAYRCAKELGYHDHAQGFYDHSIGHYNKPGVSLDGSRGSNFLKDVLIMLQNGIEDYSGFGEMGS